MVRQYSETPKHPEGVKIMPAPSDNPDQRVTRSQSRRVIGQANQDLQSAPVLQRAPVVHTEQQTPRTPIVDQRAPGGSPAGQHGTSGSSPTTEAGPRIDVAAQKVIKKVAEDGRVDEGATLLVSVGDGAMNAARAMAPTYHNRGFTSGVRNYIEAWRHVGMVLLYNPKVAVPLISGIFYAGYAVIERGLSFFYAEEREQFLKNIKDTLGQQDEEVSRLNSPIDNLNTTGHSEVKVVIWGGAIEERTQHLQAIEDLLQEKNEEILRLNSFIDNLNATDHSEVRIADLGEAMNLSLEKKTPVEEAEVLRCDQFLGSYLEVVKEFKESFEVSAAGPMFRKELNGWFIGNAKCNHNCSFEDIKQFIDDNHNHQGTLSLTGEDNYDLLLCDHDLGL